MGTRLAPPLEFHRLGSRFYQPGGVHDGLLPRYVVAHPRHVAHHQGPGLGSGDRTDVAHHVVHRHVQGGVVAEHYHADRVTDEDDVHSRGVCAPSSRGVVGRHHHDPLGTPGDLARGDGGYRDLAGNHRSASTVRRTHGCRRHLRCYQSAGKPAAEPEHSNEVVPPAGGAHLDLVAVEGPSPAPDPLELTHGGDTTAVWRQARPEYVPHDHKLDGSADGTATTDPITNVGGRPA